MSIDSPPLVCGPGRPATTPNQQINSQWRDDDQNINKYTFNINNNEVGLNPDLIKTLQTGTPLDF